MSGLITGQDLKEQLSGLDLGEKILIPCSMLKGDEEIFLDDMTLEELSEALNTEIVIVLSIIKSCNAHCIYIANYLCIFKRYSVSFLIFSLFI